MPGAVTVTRDILAPSDNSGTLRQQLTEELDAIDPRDTPFLAYKGWSMDAGASMGADSLPDVCNQQTFTWQNDQLIPNSTTLGAAYTSGAATLTVATGTGGYYRANEILVLNSAGNTTHLRVLATPAAGIDALSVTAIANDANHASGTTVTSLGIPEAPGAQAPTDGRTVAPGSDFNYTQIYMDTAAITGTEQSTERVGYANRLDREAYKTLQQLVIKMESNCIYGNRIASLPAAGIQPAARMGGLSFFIRQIDSNGNTTNANGNLLGYNGEQYLKDLLDNCWVDGGRPSVMMGNSFQRRQLSSFMVPFVRTDRNVGVAGVVVGQYEYSHGILDFVLNRYVAQEHLFTLTMDMIGIGPLKGNGNDRTFNWTEMPKDGDYERRFIVGEYTMAVRNRDRAHGMLFNLATS